MRGCACRIFAHVSCLAEQAKMRLRRRTIWQRKDQVRAMGSIVACAGHLYHGVVQCALAWACWKTHVFQHAGDLTRACSAMTVLGNGLLCKTPRERAP